jgi:predicted nucleic acid-binding protein
MIGVDTTFLVQLEITEAPQHSAARELLQREVIGGNSQLALAPQVLAEFLHVVTDQKRFRVPMTMEQALSKAVFWWTAREVKHVYPTSESTTLWLDWIGKYGLGRKRLLDTQLASILWSAGVRRIITSNIRDFSVFPGFELISP